MEKGDLCVKIAGRDAGKKCVIIEKKDHRVLIDGETRRREINQAHVMPLGEKINLQTGDHEEIKAAFKKIGIEIIDAKPKEKTERPKKLRKPPAEKPKKVKKIVKKAGAEKKTLEQSASEAKKDSTRKPKQEPTS